MNDIGTVLGDLIDGLPPEQAAVPVTGLALDSRAVRPGDVFLAVAGHVADGRDYIEQAREAGAVAVIAEAPCDADGWQLPVVAVENLSTQLSDIADRFQRHPSRQLNVIGVTGTNGKSSTVLLIAQLLEALGEPCGVMGTLGSGRFGQLSGGVNTTPDAISIQAQLRDWLDAGAHWAAMEVSSHGLVQSRVAAVQYRAAVFTNLSQDHLDYHGDMREYGAAKAQLFCRPGLELAVVNADDAFGLTLLQENNAAEVLSYSLIATDADVYPTSVHYQHDGIRAQVVTPWGELSIAVPLLGEFNLSNLLAAIGVLGGLGIDVKALENEFTRLQPLPGRMECLYAEDGLMAVVDYAHTPDALSQVLRNLRRHCEGRLWCVFGCGGDRDTSKRSQMGAIAEAGADCVIVTSDNPRSEEPAAISQQILAGMEKTPALVELDRRSAIEFALHQAEPRDLVLIAGKGHEDYQEQGGERLPFSDITCTRLALAARGRT